MKTHRCDSRMPRFYKTSSMRQTKSILPRSVSARTGKPPFSITIIRLGGNRPTSRASTFRRFGSPFRPTTKTTARSTIITSRSTSGFSSKAPCIACLTLKAQTCSSSMLCQTRVTCKRSFFRVGRPLSRRSCRRRSRARCSRCLT